MVCEDLTSVRELKMIVDYVSVNKLRVISKGIAKREIDWMNSDIDAIDLLAINDYNDVRRQVLECNEKTEFYLWGLAMEAEENLDEKVIEDTTLIRLGINGSIEYRAQLIYNNMRILDESKFGIL